MVVRSGGGLPMTPARRVCLLVFCTLLFDAAGRSQGALDAIGIQSLRTNEVTYSANVFAFGHSAVLFLRLVCDKGEGREEISVWDPVTGEFLYSTFHSIVLVNAKCTPQLLSQKYGFTTPRLIPRSDNLFRQRF